MSQCPHAVEKTSTRRRRRPPNSSSPFELLPIRTHHCVTTCLAPGATRLYCYWRIAMYIDLAQKDIELYVPPEWRYLTPEKLEDWIGRLRDHPYEDIVLGRTLYRWAIDILLPARQSYSTVPIHGRNGWPDFLEPIPYWNLPRIKYESQRLRITINRTPLLPSLGMGRVVCYWKMRLPRTVQPRRYVWVPPEWRKLTDKTRRMWARRLGANPDQPVVLGETHYYWRNDTIIPHGQNPNSIEYLGEGRYREAESAGDETSADAPDPTGPGLAPINYSAQREGPAVARMLNTFIHQYDEPVKSPDILGSIVGLTNETEEPAYEEPRGLLETRV